MSRFNEAYEAAVKIAGAQGGKVVEFQVDGAGFIVRPARLGVTVQKLRTVQEALIKQILEVAEHLQVDNGKLTATEQYDLGEQLYTAAAEAQNASD
jgi:DUF917 family protein